MARGRKRQGQPEDIRGTPLEKFGELFRSLVEKSGLNTLELAERTGLTPDSIRRYLRGERIPNIGKWLELARALGLKDVKDLIPSIPID
jgi:transcriptional regulator with XRE-family HTH domain